MSVVVWLWCHLNLPRFSGCRGSSFLSPPSSLCDAPNCTPPTPLLARPPIPLRSSHNRRHAHGGVEGVKGGGGTLPAEATASPCLPLLEGTTAPSTAGSLARSLEDEDGTADSRRSGSPLPPGSHLPSFRVLLPLRFSCPRGGRRQMTALGTRHSSRRVHLRAASRERP